MAKCEPEKNISESYDYFSGTFFVTNNKHL